MLHAPVSVCFRFYSLMNRFLPEATHVGESAVDGVPDWVGVPIWEGRSQ